MNEKPERQHDVGADADFAEGTLVALEIDGRELAVARIAGQLHAVSLRCTHAAWRMDDASLRGSEIVCTQHGARFDLRDGCPTAGPARKALDTYPIRVHDGRVELTLPARRG